MNPQIEKVMFYIESHLEEEFDVKDLAKVAGYSHYHFCRIFKLNMGESVMSYAKRLRLKKASFEVREGHKSMIEIALDAGYQTPTGFLKAFKKHFGTTPTEFKGSQWKLPQKYQGISMKNVEIVERDEAYVVFTRELGNYVKSSEIAWERLSSQLNGLEERFQSNPPKQEVHLDASASEAIGICHDNPEATDEANLRYDAALSWGQDEVALLGDYGFETKSVAGGRYAKTFYQGDYETAEKAWYGLYAWIEENGYGFRDEPAFEKYLNLEPNMNPNEIETEIYVPIQS